MEADADKYFSEERALAWRLNLERFFYRLADGYGAAECPKSLEKVRAWLFDRTKIDNRIGKFGQWMLKSQKLEDKHDYKLMEPI